jgi:Sec-independent protein secretion pathway component TatC
MDSTALFAAIGVVGVAVTYGVVKRQWWEASAICACGTAFLLGVVIGGNRSRLEHNVVLAMQLILLAYFAVAVRARMKARRRNL